MNPLDPFLHKTHIAYFTMEIALRPEIHTDLEQNTAEDRKLTHHHYGGDTAYRRKQEILLGIGGERILQALGFDITTFHLNEGHAALLTLQRPRFRLRPTAGWAVGDREGKGDGADGLYRKLSEQVLPLYCDDRARWIWMMKQAVSKIGSYFNSQRMVRRYATDAYLRYRQ